MDVLLLRLESPLMAFGGPMVDYRGPTRRFPGLAMITGLIGNALGLDHRDAAELDALQARLRFASAPIRDGTLMRDYQTVDLGQSGMLAVGGEGRGWTTRGHLEERAGAHATATGTHIRLRDYIADGCLLVALRLEPPDRTPDVAMIAGALERPARPLFIGRKPCLPAAPVRLDIGSFETLGDALRAGLHKLGYVAGGGRVPVELPADEPSGPVQLPEGEGFESLVDARDWLNQIHGGERRVRRGWLEVEAREAA